LVSSSLVALHQPPHGQMRPEETKESAQEHKVRLHKVAMSTARALVHKALANMHKRTAAIYKETGRHTAID